MNEAASWWRAPDVLASAALASVYLAVMSGHSLLDAVSCKSEIVRAAIDVDRLAGNEAAILADKEQQVAAISSTCPWRPSGMPAAFGRRP